MGKFTKIEKFLRRYQYLLIWWIIFLFVASVLFLNLQFPKELRGGVMSRLEVIEYNYSKRERDMRSQFGEMVYNCNMDKEVVQAQLRSMFEMRNDK